MVKKNKVIEKVVKAAEELVKIWLCGRSFRVDEKTFEAIKGMTEEQAFNFVTKKK
jgi:hypothetical protein